MPEPVSEDAPVNIRPVGLLPLLALIDPLFVTVALGANRRMLLLLMFSVSPLDTFSVSIVALTFRLTLDAGPPPLSILTVKVSPPVLLGNVVVAGAELCD